MKRTTKGFEAVIQLTAAQLLMFDREIKIGQRYGDCQLTGSTLTMRDYEGARAMLTRFSSGETKTKRDFFTLSSLVRETNNAIVRAIDAKEVR